jgi:hypothetical protein
MEVELVAILEDLLATVDRAWRRSYGNMLWTVIIVEVSLPI